MQLALHKCRVVSERSRGVEASADLLRGLLESLETEAWLLAQPALFKTGH